MTVMSACLQDDRSCRRSDDDVRARKIRAWATIAAALGGLLLFIYVIGPAGLETDTLKPMADFIEANDINANAYYYTEVEEFFSAERHMREYLKLVPGAAR